MEGLGLGYLREEGEVDNSVVGKMFGGFLEATISACERGGWGIYWYCGGLGLCRV